MAMVKWIDFQSQMLWGSGLYNILDGQLGHHSSTITISMRLLIKWFPYATAWNDVSVGSLRVVWRLARQPNSVLSWGFLRDGRLQKQFFSGQGSRRPCEFCDTCLSTTPCLSTPLGIQPLQQSKCSISKVFRV